MPADNEQIEYTYLINRMGLNPQQAAGVLGNIEVETVPDWDPKSFNPNEQAKGIAQWEKGRRTALQQFARARGTTEDDLNTQLDFMYKEAHGPYAYALRDIKQTDKSDQAAAIWDTEYEHSSGSTHQERMSNANIIYDAIKAGKLGPEGIAWATPGHWTSVSNKPIPDPPKGTLIYGKPKGSNIGQGGLTDKNNSGLSLVNPEPKIDFTDPGPILTWLKEYYDDGSLDKLQKGKGKWKFDALQWQFSHAALTQPKTSFDLHPIPDQGDAQAGTGPLADFLGPFESIAKFFEALLWIFNVDHFMKFLLYMFGAVAVAVGLGLVTFGSGKETGVE